MAGIIHKSDIGNRNVVMEATDFDRALLMDWDTEQNEWRDINKFEKVMEQLRVISRAKPIHKHMIVSGLKRMGKTVTSTGSGVNDCPAI